MADWRSKTNQLATREDEAHRLATKDDLQQKFESSCFIKIDVFSYWPFASLPIQPERYELSCVCYLLSELCLFDGVSFETDWACAVMIIYKLN